MRTALYAALDQVTILGTSGKPLPPFLFDSIRQTTLGPALRANCALLIAGARLAGRHPRNAGSAAVLSVGAGAWIKGEAEQAVEWPQDSLVAPPA
jgi:hypothetical protein